MQVFSTDNKGQLNKGGGGRKRGMSQKREMEYNPEYFLDRVGVPDKYTVNESHIKILGRSKQ
jgi:hypothetical protein